jgi:RNA polymerase sigma factor (sigma-70 family)
MPRTLRRALATLDRTALTDGQLLERYLAAREEAAFEALVRRHGPMVLGVCRRILRNAADAEDAFQATFLVLVRKGASVLPRNRVGHWLYGVAYRTALKARSTTARRQARERLMSTQEAFEAQAADDWLPLLDHELNRLPEKYRLPIVLCDLEGKTRKEAARHLNWAEGTVATRLTRGRALLASRLARRGVTLTAGVLALGLSREAFTSGMPASLVSATVRAATDYAAGPAAYVAVSARVSALTEGVLKTMLLTRLKTITAVALVLGLLGAGLGSGLLSAPAAPPGQAAPPQRTATTPRGTVANVPPHALPSGPLPQQAMVSLDEDDALVVQMRVVYVEPVTTIRPDGHSVTSYRQRDTLQTHQSPRGEYQAYDTKLKKISLKELRKRLPEETPALVFRTMQGKRIDPLHLRFIKEGTLIIALPAPAIPALPPIAAPAVVPPPLAPQPAVAPVRNLTPSSVSVPTGATPIYPVVAPAPVQNAPPTSTPASVAPPSMQPIQTPPQPGFSRNPTPPLDGRSPLQILMDQGGMDRVLFHIQGEWVVLAHMRDGKRVPDEEFKDYRVVIRDGQMWLSRGKGILGSKKLRVEINAAKKPVTIDTYLDGPNPRLVSHGIVEMKDEKQVGKLLVIYETPADQPRPTAFDRDRNRDPRPGFVTIYRRVSDAKAP